MTAPRMHVLPMGATQLEERVLDEERAREQRILDEVLAGPTVTVRCDDCRMTIGQVLELAAPLCVLGYAVRLDWVRDSEGEIAGITIHGVKGVGQGVER